MTVDHLRRLVARGEGQTIEFKRRVPSPDRLAKEVIAFANTSGGQLLLGVTDDGQIVGVKDSEEEEFSLRNALSSFCRPAVDWASSRVPVSNKRDVIMVSIPSSRSKPHFLVDESNGMSGSAYVRIDDKSVEATEESVRLMQAEKETSGVHFEFGDRELMLLKYLEQFGSVTIEEFAKLAHIDGPDASDIMVTLTRAGVLTQHREPRGDYYTLHYGETG
ncbi:MAG: ATP-binding protein [Rhodothermales bacterium]|nr:ATP-binding protein [Rhodothermales bacterium]